MERDSAAVNGFGVELGETENMETSVSAERPLLMVCGDPLLVEPLDSCLPQPAYALAQHGQVMTDEQTETLRRQISVYATICQQLMEMHKASMSMHLPFAGFALNRHLPYDQYLGMQKATARQRWTPSHSQLQILESLFDEGNGSPNKQRIKEITGELSQHGLISETNVYNWFQNRKARAKRKLQSTLHKDGDSEPETDADSPQDKQCRVDVSTHAQSRLVGAHIHSFGMPGMIYQNLSSRYENALQTPVSLTSNFPSSKGAICNYDMVSGGHYKSGFCTIMNDAGTTSQTLQARERYTLKAGHGESDATTAVISDWTYPKMMGQ